MKASTRWIHCLLAMLEVADHYNRGPIQLRLIAERHGISIKYLEQHMVFLRSAGFIRSVRGAKGGYILPRAPDQIRLSELYRCLEGDVSTVDCVTDPEFCTRRADCVTNAVWQDVEAAVHHVLDAVTLEDLLNRSKRFNNQSYA